MSIMHLILLPIALAISFAPTIIAFKRNHGRKWWVLALQLLLGWTGIGWIAALVWAIIGKPYETDVVETFK